jgi:hypothetical protein
LRTALRTDPTISGGGSRWLRVLTRVEELGGRVTPDEWRDIGAEFGYDPRGLGGFFRGANASMRIDGEDRVLTDQGARVLDEFGRQQ